MRMRMNDLLNWTWHASLAADSDAALISSTRTGVVDRMVVLRKAVADAK